MSWNFLVAGAVAVGLVATSARAGDLFKLALPPQALPQQGGYDHYPYPPSSVTLGFGYPGYFAPPAYYAAPPACYPPPAYYPPISTAPGVTTYSLPEGNVTYSVTRPFAPAGPEQLVVLPIPRAEPGATSSPRFFHIATQFAELRPSLPRANKKASAPAKGNYIEPASGEEPRRAAR